MSKPVASPSTDAQFAARPARTPENVATVIEQSAAGKSVRAIAEDIGVSSASVQRMRTDNQEAIRDLQERLARGVLERLQAEREKWLGTSMQVVSTPGERTAPQLLRVLGEMGGLIGRNNVSVYGDVNVDASTSVTISDQRRALLIAGDASDREATMCELRRQIGLAT